MVQANELGMHAIGVDISAFNSLIANVKIGKVDFDDLNKELQRITLALKDFIKKNNNTQFENELLEKLNIFNKKYFPSPDFKIKVRNKEINDKEYTPQKENEFLKIFNNLKKKYNLTIKQQTANNFLEKWYLKPVKDEIDFTFEQLKRVKNPATKKIITIILSRTIRSCRATTHADLATLKEPVTTTYYCSKHGKICKPLFSMLSWWQRYSKDTVERLKKFDTLRTDTYQLCIQGDARNIGFLSIALFNFYNKLYKQSIEVYIL